MPHAVAVTDVTDGASHRAVIPVRGVTNVIANKDGLDLTLPDIGFDGQPPATTWRLRFDANLTAGDGQTLGYPWIGFLRSTYMSSFVNLGGTVWEAGGGPLVPVHARNAVSLTQWIAPVITGLGDAAVARVAPGVGTSAAAQEPDAPHQRHARRRAEPQPRREPCALARRHGSRMGGGGASRDPRTVRPLRGQHRTRAAADHEPRHQREGQPAVHARVRHAPRYRAARPGRPRRHRGPDERHAVAGNDGWRRRGARARTGAARPRRPIRLQVHRHGRKGRRPSLRRLELGQRGKPRPHTAAIVSTSPAPRCAGPCLPIAGCTRSWKRSISKLWCARTRRTACACCHPAPPSTSSCATLTVSRSIAGGSPSTAGAARSGRGSVPDGGAWALGKYSVEISRAGTLRSAEDAPDVEGSFVVAAFRAAHLPRRCDVDGRPACAGIDAPGHRHREISRRRLRLAHGPSVGRCFTRCGPAAARSHPRAVPAGTLRVGYLPESRERSRDYERRYRGQVAERARRRRRHGCGAADCGRGRPRVSYTFEVDVEDESGHHIASRAGLVVHPASLYVAMSRLPRFVEHEGRTDRRRRGRRSVRQACRGRARDRVARSRAVGALRSPEERMGAGRDSSRGVDSPDGSWRNAAADSSDARAAATSFARSRTMQPEGKPARRSTSTRSGRTCRRGVAKAITSI